MTVASDGKVMMIVRFGEFLCPASLDNSPHRRPVFIKNVLAVSGTVDVRRRIGTFVAAASHHHFINSDATFGPAIICLPPFADLEFKGYAAPLGRLYLASESLIGFGWDLAALTCFSSFCDKYF
jgi:hypothetical protein